jgi:hypothetical protein
MKQAWYCECCHFVGCTAYDPGTDVMTVVEKIGRDHKRKSPQCPTTYMYLRAVNMKSDTWLKLVISEEVPSWAVNPIAEMMGYERPKMEERT